MLALRGTGIFQWATARLSRLWPRWRRAVSAPAIAPAPVASAPQGGDRATEVEEAGRWYFRRDILDKLDDYMDMIRRMRSVDPDAYALYARVGAVIVGDRGLIPADASDMFVPGRTRVGFGAVAYLGEDDADIIGTKFAYFEKLASAPWDCQPASGDIYRVSFIHADRADRRMTSVQWCYVAISDAGEIRPLKRLFTRRQSIIPKTLRGKKAARAKGGSAIYHHYWGWGDWVKHTVSEKMPERRPEEAVKLIFSLTYGAYHDHSMGIRVNAERGGISAAFCIDMLRTPYFFADRDPTFNDRGKKRRIFHIVRPHARRRAGRTTYVKAHFRGERRFIWNGYRVVVSLPGRHHADMLDLSFAGHEVPDGEPFPKNAVGRRSLARRLRQHLSGGVPS